MTGPFGGLSPRTAPEGEPCGLGLVLPGRAYSPSAPLLELARLTLLQHGYAVRQVWWDAASRPADVDPGAWVAEQAETALAAEAEPPRRVVIIAKSLGTWATTYAAERGHAAVWLTPLLVEPALVAGVRANPAPQLLVGGTADDLWGRETAEGLVGEGCTVSQISGADHALCVPGDAVASARVLVEVTELVDGFLSRLDAE